MYAKLRMALPILVCTIMCSMAVAAQTAPSAASERAAPTEIVGMVRRINTAELGPWFKSHHYVSLAQVLQGRTFHGSEDAPALSDTSSGRCKGYVISLVASPDGKHYLLALSPGSGCGFSAFSDQSGVIYTGSALGCTHVNDPAGGAARPAAKDGKPSRSSDR